MKTKLLLRIAGLALASTVGFHPSALMDAAPIGTSFTYQGQLAGAGSPANGRYDFTFTLYDAPNNDAVVGVPLTNSAVAVSNGLFTVVLNFGPGAFNGDARWLETGVRSNGAVAEFTLLSPRQPLTPTPYALYAPSAGTAVFAVVANLAGTNSVNSASLQADSVTGDKIANGTITDTKISAGGISADKIISGDLQAERLKVGFRPHADGKHSHHCRRPQQHRQHGLLCRRWRPAECRRGNAAVIGGGKFHTASGQMSAIGGGDGNNAAGSYTTVAGGLFNSASNLYAVVAGGFKNVAGGDASAVSGGSRNTASGYGAFVGGGGYDGITEAGNVASGPASVIGGGISNTASNSYATVPGGASNVAAGQYSFVSGRQAKAIHSGAFVWADSTDAYFASSGTNQFLVRAGGGVGIGTNNPCRLLYGRQCNPGRFGSDQDVHRWNLWYYHRRGHGGLCELFRPARHAHFLRQIQAGHPTDGRLEPGALRSSTGHVPLSGRD